MSRDTGALIYGAVPRADLMPPEVAIRRKESARRRGLVSLMLLVLLIVVGGIVASNFAAAQAEQRLADERALTQQLLTEQLEYVEVQRIQTRLVAVDAQRASIAGVDVAWRDVLEPYLDVLGGDDIIDGVVASSNVPFEPPLALEGPLRVPRSATVELSILSSSMPDPDRWIRAWESESTFADASIDSIALEPGEGWLTVLTLNLSREALSPRAAEEVPE